MHSYGLHSFYGFFIPGRAAHVMKLKEAYFVQVPAEIKTKKKHNGKKEECDGNLTRKPKRQ